MSDEGQALGVYQHADYTQNWNEHKTETFGKKYDFIGNVKARLSSSSKSNCV